MLRFHNRTQATRFVFTTVTLIGVMLVLIGSGLTRGMAAQPSEGDALWQLSLTETDLLPGFISDGGEVLDNASLAARSDDPAAVQQQFDAWGRIDGYHILFLRVPAADGYPSGVAASIDRYQDTAGAAAAVAGMPDLVMTYGASYYVAAEPLDAPTLGDEGALMRLTGREDGRDVVHYWYRFHIGALYADVTTAAFRPEEDDGGAAAVVLATVVHERIDHATRTRE